jgi:hypothetical protein
MAEQQVEVGPALGCGEQLAVYLYGGIVIA